MKLCKCGAIVEKRCKSCYPDKHDRTTTERGYDGPWKRLSKRVRNEQPLCPMCEAEGRAIPATEVHHVEPIAIAPNRRLDRSNLVALCNRHHNEVEHDK
jgi:5-methylcytosine-specific restriction enzyme A